MIKKTRSLIIGVVVDQLLSGGVQLAAIEQVKELNHLGHQAKLIILMRKKYPTDYTYLAQGIDYQYLSDSYPKFFRKTFKLPIFSFLSTLHLVSPIFAPMVVKPQDFDILISHGTTTCLTTQAIFRKNKIPYIAVIHDPISYILDKCYSNTSLKYLFPLLIPLSNYFERSFVKDAVKTVIDSKVHFSFLKQKYNLNPNIIPLGTTIPTNLPHQRGSYLISIGRWQKEKNPEFLLKLVRNIPSSKLIIAGNWLSEKDLIKFKNMIKKLSLIKRVEIVTNYDEQILAQLCAKARVFIHPHFEAFGLAALEAAAHGLPIIIPQKSGVSEIFNNGIEGFFPQSVNLAEYKKYVVKLMHNERLAYKMGQNAANKAKEEISWQKNTRQMLDLIYSSLKTDIRKKIAVLEICHVLGDPLAGGDKLMEPMAVRLKEKFNFSVIVSSIGAKHWVDAPLEKNLLILPRNRFDQISYPVPLFLAYCVRMYQTSKLLITKLGKTDFLYSSTNILPDILPAYIAKIIFPRQTWIARIHHLIPVPYKRPGKLVVNTVSYLMQYLALSMIKNKADLIIVLNSNLKKELIKQNFNKEKLKVLGAGIEFNKITTTKILPQTKKYDGVFLGRLHYSKGILDLVPIWKEVVKKIPDARLAVIGRGEKTISGHLKEQLKTSLLENNIDILGYMSNDKTYSLMKKAKVFLFTDHEAGWGIAVAEAMTCRLPVIGYDIGILGSVYKEGFIKVKLSDYTGFSQAIIKIINSPRLQQKLADKAFNQSIGLDWKYTAENFSRFTQDIV